MTENTLSIYDACLLHSRADRVVRMMVARNLEQYDLTMMEWLLIATVSQGPKEGMTMTQVAQKLEVTLPQITALMGRVVNNNLLEQRISDLDRRSRRLYATRSGRVLAEKVTKTLDTALREWTSEIPRDELRTYLKTLQRLIELGSDEDIQ